MKQLLDVCLKKGCSLLAGRHLGVRWQAKARHRLRMGFPAGIAPLQAFITRIARIPKAAWRFRFPPHSKALRALFTPSFFQMHSSLLATVAALFFGGCSPPAALPKRFEVPKFTFTERSGQPFDSASLLGKVWVADFFFTSCPGTCLMLSNRMKEIHAATAKTGDVRFVSISTDPAADTPEVLQKYAASLGADARWSFLTGARTAIFKLSITGFKLALADAGGVDVKEKIIHSTKLVLVDRHGWIRDYYDGVGDNSAEKERLLADIKRLLNEP